MALSRIFHVRTFGRWLERGDFWLFELSVWLHIVAKTLVYVFVPVLLYQAGFTIGEIMIYYVIYHALDLPLNFLVPPLIRRFGARLVIAFSAVFAIGFFSLLTFITPGNWVTLMILALFVALYDVMYWVAHLYLFIQSNQQGGHTDRNTGIIYSVKKLGMVVGPAVGGFILLFAGNTALLITSIVLFAVSLIPLARVDDFPDKPVSPEWSFRQFFAYVRDRKNYFSMALFAVHRGVEMIIWPLFIYVIFESVRTVALVPIIISATAIIFTYFSRESSVPRREAMIIIGSVALALVWGLRLIITAEWFIYVSIFLVGLCMLLISIPLNADIFDRAKKTDPLAAATYRNIASMGAKLVMFIVLAITVNVFQVSFVVAAFAMIALASVNGLFLVLWRAGNEEGLLPFRPQYNFDEH